MNEKFQYRLSKDLKREIAQNLIDIFQKDVNINESTKTFISNWLCTGPEEKRKAFFDVWDIVLKNYLPKERPMLFRSCRRISKTNKIASFTESLKFAKRFGNSKDYLLIFDTKEELEFEETFYKKGGYKHTFYPLVNVLVKAKESGGWGFSERIWSYINEEEYIMRIDFEKINKLRWANFD